LEELCAYFLLRNNSEHFRATLSKNGQQSVN
jgi:hypothetical protein